MLIVLHVIRCRQNLYLFDSRRLNLHLRFLLHFVYFCYQRLFSFDLNETMTSLLCCKILWHQGN